MALLARGADPSRAVAGGNGGGGSGSGGATAMHFAVGRMGIS